MDGFFNEYEAIKQCWWPYITTFIVCLIGAIRMYIGGSVCPSRNRIDGKTVVITGGSSGIGLATARELSARGATIILAVRNAERGKTALDLIKNYNPEARAIIKLIDMTDFNNIRDFVNQIQLEYEKIDILINNAGIIFHPFQKTIDGNETTIATNYFGPFLLTHLLLPLLNKAENGRVINISAISHLRAKLNLDDLNSERKFVEMEVFGQSKLALTMFTKQMASLLKHSNMTFNAVNPGLVRGTRHLRNSKLTRFPTNLSVMPWMFLFMKTPKQGCQSVVYAAVEPSLNNVSGCYISNCEIQNGAEMLQDAEMCEKLYNKTCEIIDIKGEEYTNFKKKNTHTQLIN